MRKLLFVLSPFICFLSYSQSNIKDAVYLDQFNHEVSKEFFEKIQKTQKLSILKNDSLNIFKIKGHSGESGKLLDVTNFRTQLEKGLKRKLDSAKPIIIIFHPGKDSCNSSGQIKSKELKKWFEKLEREIKKTTNIKPIYLYKNFSGLEKYDGLVSWEKDPNGFIENTFFTFHYPCSSFVIISPSGKYQAGFGEFSQDVFIKVLKDTISFK